MIATNPYELFTPIHLAWLYRQHDKNLDVTAADLDSIQSHQPDAPEDPLFAEYRALQLDGRLHKRRGRKPMSASMWWFLTALRAEIREESDAIYARRRQGLERRCPGDFEPCYLAAETVARNYRLPISGRSLVKKISKAGIR